MKDSEWVARTEAWVRDFVIGLGICPFAERVVSLGGLRMRVSDAETPRALGSDLVDELHLLTADENARDATTLLIHPRTLLDFDDFNQFLDDADGLLESAGLVGVVQIASFHPDYRFEGSAAEAPENYTNRSPFPMLHLLLEADVSDAVASHPDPSGIPSRNIEMLREMGTSAIRARLRKCGALPNGGT